ncbi:pyrimidine-specific ribonucleoside hydrolase [Mumia flava]|uniref:Pyrimidine-specific ribonucleoside hydrolase n=1 Tax=Mumia flava TaxID=1348852 RepID=A0A2M9BD95_9ACTN|nr:nucleoside hydrolase [Mumia flava]PJJ55923.1 pyrimidine-specific ribonucleoside hydrolase [Mumia flava]
MPSDSLTRPRPLVLDVDTGIDDALAIMFAVRHPGLDLRAISCVAGNAGVDRVVANTLAVLDTLGAGEVPVARGAQRPLLQPARDARHVHGADGLGGQNLPASQRTPYDTDAVTMLRRAILDSADPVTLVPLAPMTNVALLLRTYPEVVDNIAEIVFMGGAISGGNASAVAEFNVWHDPEAAAIVLDSGLDVVMYGLDVFYQVAVDPSTYGALAEDPDPAVALAGRLLAHSHHVVRSDPRAAGGGLIGDAGAVCAVAAPDLVTLRTWPVHVELAGRSRGQTVVDRRSIQGEDAVHGVEETGPPIRVAADVDARATRDLFLATLGATTQSSAAAAESRAIRSDDQARR